MSGCPLGMGGRAPLDGELDGVFDRSQPTVTSVTSAGSGARYQGERRARLLHEDCLPGADVDEFPAKRCDWLNRYTVSPTRSVSEDIADGGVAGSGVG